MNDDPTTTETKEKSWLERLSIALLREPQDREQLVALLRDAQQRELLDADALAMIEGVLQVSNMKVRDVMIPRSQMVALKHDAKLEQIIPTVIESNHSRFPVIGESRDDILGILLAKDLLAFHYGKDEGKPFEIAHVMRPAIFVPESKRLDVLLREFRLNHNHMAIVVDEYGGIAGLVTIEDVLEQIVGEIEDEYDIDEEVFIKPHGEGEFIVKALTPIEEFNKFFHETLSDEEFDTIGGYVMSKFGYLPKRGEEITIGRYQIRVLHADNRRIQLLQFKVAPDQGE